MILWFAACAGLALLLLGNAASAACPPDVSERSRGGEVLDARTLTLADGRVIRLAGIAVRSDQEAETRAALRALVQGQALALRPASDRPDRWGRLIAHVDLADGTSLEEVLLRQGRGHAAASVSSACLRPLLAAEQGAQAERLGVWAVPGYVISAAAMDMLARFVGEHVVLEGRVRSARAVGDRIYIDFGRRGSGLSVVARKRDWSRLGLGDGSVAGSLRGQTLRVRGHLEWRLGPLINANGSEPLERLDRPSVAAR